MHTHMCMQQMHMCPDILIKVSQCTYAHAQKSAHVRMHIYIKEVTCVHMYIHACAYIYALYMIKGVIDITTDITVLCVYFKLG